MEPRIQYAQTADGVSIAFWTLGEGMPTGEDTVCRSATSPTIPWTPMCWTWRRWWTAWAWSHLPCSGFLMGPRGHYLRSPLPRASIAPSSVVRCCAGLRTVHVATNPVIGCTSRQGLGAIHGDARACRVWVVGR